MASSCSSRAGAPMVPPTEEERAGRGRGAAAGGGCCWGTPTRRGSSDAKIRLESVPGDDLMRRSTSARDLESGIKGITSGLPRISLRHVDGIQIVKINPRVYMNESNVECHQTRLIYGASIIHSGRQEGVESREAHQAGR
jgi:hypothetical protein